MQRFWLFALVSGLGALGAFLGSILGNAVGKAGLFAGAVLGGAIAVALGVRIAAQLRLVPQTRIAHATLGGLGGFALAVLIAVNTLSSPIGPILSVALIGLGGVVRCGETRAVGCLRPCRIISVMQPRKFFCQRRFAEASWSLTKLKTCRPPSGHARSSGKDGGSTTGPSFNR